MGNTETLVQKLKNIANATREKTGGTELLKLDQIDEEILSIEGEETHEDYKGPTEVTPSFEQTTLPTTDTALDEDIVVKPINVTVVSNTGGGSTLII